MAVIMRHGTIMEDGDEDDLNDWADCNDDDDDDDDDDAYFKV